MKSFLGTIAIACLALMALRPEGAARPAAERESTRSAPPDTTPYVRPASPEDYAPLGRPALGPGVSTKPRGATRESPPQSASPDGKSNAPDTHEEQRKAPEQE